MWLMFYASVHNSSGRNIWISSYSISAKTEDGWTQLIQPRQPVSKNTLFFLAALRLQALKPESAFDYNASRAPIAPDGDVSGWMFSESRITKRILKLKVEFYDKDGTVHRREVNAATAQFGAGPPPSGLANLEVPRFDVETGSPLTPELDAYRREMRPYVSLFKMPGSL